MSTKSSRLRACACFLLILAVMLSASGCRRAADPDTYLIPIETPTPKATAAPTSEPTDAPEPTAAPDGADGATGDEGGEQNVTYAAGYVRVLSPTQSGWLALPAEGEAVFPLRQMTEDGRITENIIHLTADGVYMESANCDNQDCVHQGEVTLENRDERALSNMIICLPNQVYVELYSTEELLGAVAAQEDTGE